MNVDELHAKLIAAARKHPPSEHVPLAFEKRVLSQLAARSAPNVWALWCRPLWQGAIFCAVLTLACGLWMNGSASKPESADDFSQAFEAAVYAPVSEHIEDAW
jgi:hypothetical protein